MAELKHRSLVILFCSVVALSLVASSAAGLATQQSEVNIDAEAEYDGSDADPPATEVSVVISAESAVEELTVTVSSTDESFAAHETTDLSTSPAGIGVERVGEGEFSIGELESGEEVEITLDMFPRSIAVAESDIATVQVEAPNLEESETVTVDLSGTSYNQQQSDQIWRTISLVLGGVLVLVAVVAIGYAIVGRDGDDDDSGGISSRR